MVIELSVRAVVRSKSRSIARSLKRPGVAGHAERGENVTASMAGRMRMKDIEPEKLSEHVLDSIVSSVDADAIFFFRGDLRRLLKHIRFLQLEEARHV